MDVVTKFQVGMKMKQGRIWGTFMICHIYASERKHKSRRINEIPLFCSAFLSSHYPSLLWKLLKLLYGRNNNWHNIVKQLSSNLKIN